MSREEESRLADRLAAGDASAFRDLVESFKKKVYGLAYEMTKNHTDAEDVSQMAFMKAFKGIGTFRRGASLNSWLYRIVYNSAIDHLRKRPFFSQEAGAEAGFSRGSPSADPQSRDLSSDPQKAAEITLLRCKIDRALNKVSKRERSAFILRHYHDLDMKEIAEVLGISPGAVKSYLFRSIKKLQKEMFVSGRRLRWETDNESMPSI